jgi:uncharacterized membrane protein YedE/YeeE
MATASPLNPDPQETPEVVAHERTYKAFNILLRWCMTLLAATISFLTLWFATSAGFVGALIAGVVIFALGYFVLVKTEAEKPLDVWQE